MDATKSTGAPPAPVPTGTTLASRLEQREIKPLTSLRFFAALAVLLFHSGSSALISTGLVPAPVANFLRNGDLGVSFFFILSGFILTFVYYGKLGSGRRLMSYARARFARIYPVYALALVLMLPFVTVTSLGKDLP